MNRITAFLFVCLASGVGPAFAKPGSVCENALGLTKAAIEAQGLLWISAHDKTVSLIMFDAKDARSRKLEMIRANLQARGMSTAVYSTSPRLTEGKIVRAVDQLDKNEIKRFIAAHVLIIDTLEDFLDDVTPARSEAHLNLLRKILHERVRNRRPSILALDDVSSGDRYLFELTPRPDVSDDNT